MSLDLPVKDSFVSSLANAATPSCNIRGRMIPFSEVLPRLKNYCLSLGFKRPSVCIPEILPTPGSLSGNDSVVILAAKVAYEPSWGVYGGLPRPLIHEQTDQHLEGTISSFIAPYLRQYQFAQKHIYLVYKKENQYLITLPKDLVSGGPESGGDSLKILLDKIVDPDGDGLFSPLCLADDLLTFKISEQFLHLLSEKQFSWKAGKVQRIGNFLTDSLFHFEDSIESDSRGGYNGGKSVFRKTLLPVMNCIVTNAHPQLLAAMIYLQSSFSEAVFDMSCVNGKNDTANLLCIAGLDIDVAAFKGRGKRYFVPWAAYWKRHGIDDETKTQLTQDDLFVALMAQNKCCVE